MIFRYPVFLLALSVFAGCENPDYTIVPVSGTVTLNAKPLADASIGFEPIGSSSDPTPGPGSFAKTDAQGRYILRTLRDGDGAVVGEHRVRISTFRTEDTENGGWRVVAKEKLPPRYNAETSLTFAVPPEGTEKADFDLKLKAPPAPTH